MGSICADFYGRAEARVVKTAILAMAALSYIETSEW